MNSTVTAFYDKDSYQESYESQHGPRLDALVAHWGLRERLRGKRVVDVGGGLGFLGKRLQLDPYSYYVIDGASVSVDQRLCEGLWLQRDLDHDAFGTGFTDWGNGVSTLADAAFCLETLEHLGNPHHALVEIKKLVRPGGEIYLSIPPVSVWHNVPYPGLMWPRGNWEVFLQQMALAPFEYWPYVPANRGWPAECYRCTNAPWSSKQLLFPKDEAKFRDCTPLEATNL